MPLYTYNASSNQSPDATLGGVAVSTPSNTGHASTTSSASGAGVVQRKSCRWFSFPASAGQIKSKTLKFDYSSDGTLSGPSPANLFEVDYSLNGGSTWTAATSRLSYSGAQGTTTFSLSLSVTQDLTQVQVRDVIEADGNDPADSATAIGTVSNIRIEVQVYDSPIIVMM